ncbi:MAG: biotin--[acetyl-CoA-carboxylase] ligase [Magnetospirillum sp.]|nr:biotin--[acetyl-CoA-carboxylase] ligase [Magnetospirillum sp.]
MTTENGLPAPFSLIRLDSVGSTNDEARRLALSGAAADLLVVSAMHQSAGRGRRGRPWVSPPGNLHCSLLVRLDGDLGTAAQLGFAAAVALVDAFRTLVPGVAFTCKWPNDVLAHGPAARGKCCGMLLEPVGHDWLILGIGVDVVAAPPPGELVYPACCLADFGFGGSEMDVLAAFAAAFRPLLAEWRRDGFAPIREAWLHRSQGVGEPVLVRLEGETLTGLFAGLDAEGALLLDQASSGLRRILAGDVYFPDGGGSSPEAAPFR